MFLPSGTETRHDVQEGYDVYYLPYRGGYRDRIIARHGEKKRVLQRKFLTYLELLFQNFSWKALPYHNLYGFTRNLLKQDPSYRLLLTSGMPFGLFGICHRLHRELGIPWIADYRDDWNTTSWLSNYEAKSHLLGRKSLPDAFLSLFERRSEKKWLSSARLITTVSRHYAHKISDYVMKPARVIYNGYDVPEQELMTSGEVSHSGEFIISYTGSLYYSQPVEIFAGGLALAHRQHPEARFRVNFIGTGYDAKQEERLRLVFRDSGATIQITRWMPLHEVYREIRQSHLLLAIGNANIRGVIASKTFVYMAFRKPVLLCPPDRDEMEEVLMASGLCHTAPDASSACEVLIHGYEQFMNQRPMITPDAAFIAKFSRKHQAEKLAGIIKQVLAS